MQKTIAQEQIKVLRNIEMFFWAGVTIFFIMTVACYIAWIWGADGRWVVTALSLCVVCFISGIAIDRRATQLERLVKKAEQVNKDHDFDS